jgi:hypothetical protein
VPSSCLDSGVTWPLSSLATQSVSPGLGVYPRLWSLAPSSGGGWAPCWCGMVGPVTASANGSWMVVRSVKAPVSFQLVAKGSTDITGTSLLTGMITVCAGPSMPNG